MKRFILVLFLVSLMMLTGCSKSLSSGVESGTVIDGQFEIGYSGKTYFAYSYIWDGKEDSMEVVLPDTYAGKDISAVGGAIDIPAPFHIDMPDEFDIPNKDDKAFMTEEESLVSDTEYDTYVFTIHIGANVKDFYGLYNEYYGREDDTQDVFYKIEYNYVIDEENNYLKIVDGEIQKK